MYSDDYQKMVDMSTGKVPRDQRWLDQLAIEGHKREEALARAKYEREHPPARSHRELELEQRKFNLMVFGKTAMERYARPLDEVDELAVPGDVPVVRVLQEHGAEQRPVVPAHLKLKCHSGEPIRQVLQLV